MRTVGLAIALLSLGCSLAPFEPTLALDAGERRDAASAADASAADASAVDAGPRDAATGPDASDDAGVEVVDAGFDAAVDANVPDACVPRTETCNMLDDDCNGRADEGLDTPCMNACGTPGAIRCVGGMLTACSAPAVPSETCNAMDDDCDGTIDEGGACSCRTEMFGAHAYLFCSTPLRWLQARDRCRMMGYTLATIDDVAEHTFVAMTALMERSADWWIGLSDREMEGRFVWESGSPLAYTSWGTGQPNDMFGEDCVEISDGSAAGETRGLWADDECNENANYVCESP